MHPAVTSTTLVTSMHPGVDSSALLTVLLAEARVFIPVLQKRGPGEQRGAGEQTPLFKDCPERKTVKTVKKRDFLS